MLTEFRLVGCARRGPTDFDQACEILWGTLYGIASLSYLGSVGNDRARSLVEQALRTILLGRRTETPPNGRPANSQVLRPLWFAGFRGRTGAFVEFVFVGLPIDRDDVEEAQETAFELDGGPGAAPGGAVRTGVADCATLNVVLDGGSSGEIQVLRVHDAQRELLPSADHSGEAGDIRAASDAYRRWATNHVAPREFSREQITGAAVAAATPSWRSRRSWQGAVAS
ncbi:hypothetical protein [Streptomyces sp. AK08-02]|uniref:hypothetical protein n=1 Tax=Streptomyces sp. AK08-02 TaxID=3028654 RepID=UPI0029AA628F|nr:hypothetical protein [Streptomyces sp. AK08-02]MDX3745076.1 hypothetical protein [Streptomyces sp. AK08-02]